MIVVGGRTKVVVCERQLLSIVHARLTVEHAAQLGVDEHTLRTHPIRKTCFV